MLLNIILFLTGFNTYLVLWIIFWKDKYYLQMDNWIIELWQRQNVYGMYGYSERIKKFNLKFWEKDEQRN